MSSVQDIYNELFAGKQVTVRAENKEQFHSLRTALCKKNQICVALEMTDGSIVARWNEELKQASFELKIPPRKLAENRWEIVSSMGDLS